MATSVLSVSIPNELADFLDKNESLSPSKILQAKLWEIKDQMNQHESMVKALSVRNQNLASKLGNILEWCEDNKVIIPDNVLV